MNAPLFLAQGLAPATGLDFDWGTALTTIAVGFLTYLGARAVKRSEAKSVTRTEVVDDTVLGRFEALQTRVSQLEKDLERAFEEIGRLQYREEQLEGKVSAKDKEIISLRIANADLREELSTLYGEIDDRPR